jgi:hypothetical protein
MKLILLGFFFISSIPAYALQSEKIWNSLSVKGKNVTPKSWYYTRLYEKSVGGLVCSYKKDGYEPDKYWCNLTINLDTPNLHNIYAALNVKEVAISKTVFEKKVGELIIRKDTKDTDTYYLKN